MAEMLTAVSYHRAVYPTPAPLPGLQALEAIQNTAYMSRAVQRTFFIVDEDGLVFTRWGVPLSHKASRSVSVRDLMAQPPCIQLLKALRHMLLCL